MMAATENRKYVFISPHMKISAKATFGMLIVDVQIFKKNVNV